jgi:outer membrane protein
MKKLLPLLFFLLPLQTFAQKVGYLDMKFILSKMPEYKKAEDELGKTSANWQKEVEDMFAEVAKLRQEYLAEEILMTEEMKKERMAIIIEKEKKAKERQSKIFGFEGLLFLKRQELMTPVQDKAFDAVEKVCKKRKVQMMFDKSSDITLIYMEPKHDYTDYVLEELGLGDKNDTIDNKRGSGQAKPLAGSEGGGNSGTVPAPGGK